MDRRTLLKTSLGVGVVGQLSPPQDLFKTLSAIDDKPMGFKRFSLGDLELTILTDGYMRQSPVYPFLAPLAKADDVKKALETAFRSTDTIDVPLNILVVKSKDRLILLDTGLGIFAGPTQGYLLKSLAEAGFKPADFTDVILSHAHTDHIGGLIDKQDALVFPNAAVHMAKVEYDFWQKATLESFKKSPAYQMQDFVNQSIANSQRILNLLTSNLKFIDVNKKLYGIFSFDLAPGHTPGMTMMTINSKNEKLMFIADLVHSDALLFSHPEWGFFGDTDIQQAIMTRKNVLRQLSASKTKAFAYHLPWPGLGYVRPKGTAFEWVPDVFATP